MTRYLQEYKTYNTNDTANVYSEYDYPISSFVLTVFPNQVNRAISPDLAMGSLCSN